MSNAFSLRCIYLSCKVLYFILSDDDFEIKSKIYSFNLRLVSKHVLHSQDIKKTPTNICNVNLHVFTIMHGSQHGNFIELYTELGYSLY